MSCSPWSSIILTWPCFNRFEWTDLIWTLNGEQFSPNIQNHVTGILHVIPKVLSLFRNYIVTVKNCKWQTLLQKNINHFLWFRWESFVYKHFHWTLFSCLYNFYLYLIISMYDQISLLGKLTTYILLYCVHK